MIIPFWLQLPPKRIRASARICGAPPSMSILLSLPWAENPSVCPSGDQKGEEAPSVPGSDRDASESRERIHRRDCPSEVATNARLSPFGESANAKASRAEGVLISTRISLGAGPRRTLHEVAAAAITDAEAMIHANTSRRDRT